MPLSNRGIDTAASRASPSIGGSPHAWPSRRDHSSMQCSNELLLEVHNGCSSSLL
jgi:hypothetical protein